LLLAIYTILPPAYALGPPRLGLPLLSASASSAVVQNDLWIRIFVERKQVSFPLLNARLEQGAYYSAGLGSPLSGVCSILLMAHISERGSELSQLVLTGTARGRYSLSKAFGALLEKLTPSIVGVSPDTSCRGVAGLHGWRVACTWRELALILC
jgi:hypothetical protein